jgi:hypothetical protein
MAKYTIVYISGHNGESNDAALTLVNEVPNPLPQGNWTSYKHDSRTVMEIWTSGADATVVIVPPGAGTLSDQNVKAKLGMASGQRTKSTWTASGNGMRLDMAGAAESTTFDLTDSHLPPVALRVTVLRPNL